MAVLMPGTLLGPYRIEALVGSGGMGEVYKATDTRLDRIVAVKVVSADVAVDPLSQERFEREARAVSKLDHPHICALFDVGHEDGIHFLVMPFLDGQSLRTRLKRGAMPLREALRSAIQIADALDKAHREGIIHRDLKPGNVMLTRNGAKLLDFGLAKVVLAAPPGSDQTTQAHTLSTQNVLIGTLAYMAPEQLDGRPIDERTDIFAFGALVYEMVAGQRAFEGETRTLTIVNILDRDPQSLVTLLASMPPTFDRTIRKCLAKAPDDRWQTARDLFDELKWIDASWDDASSTQARPRPRGRQLLALAAAAIGVAALGAAAGYLARPAPTPTLVRFPMLPQNAQFGDFALSPDGKLLAFVQADRTTQLWLRPLDGMTAQPVPGTNDAFNPFWSPDGAYVAFFAGGKLKKVATAGGPVQTLCDAPQGRGGAWSSRGTIIFAPDILGPLLKVSATGGTPTPVTSLDAARQEDSHRKPSFLPDGRHFLFTARSVKHENSGVFIASTDSPERSQLLNVETGAEYTSQGLLLFVREGTQGTLMALPFDADRLRATGTAFPVGDRVPPEVSKFSVSNGGVLAYTSAPSNVYVWFDRAGARLSTATPPGRYGSIALSPDGTRAATRRVLQGNTDLWVIDIARGTTSRLTTNPAVEDDPVWSPDGEHIAFSSTRETTSDIYQVQAAGAGVEEPLLISEKPKGPSDWSPDGRFILFTQNDPATLSDIWALPLFGDRRPFPVLQTEFMEAQARLSNDGRWMAYESSESGKWEVYLQTFPRSSRKWQVSTDGGAQPLWQRDGREIFYVDPKGTVMAVPVSLAGTVDIASPAAAVQDQSRLCDGRTGTPRPPMASASSSTSRWWTTTAPKGSISS